MKWGKYLNVVVNRTPEWAQYYINYKKLKGMVHAMAVVENGKADDGGDDDDAGEGTENMETMADGGSLNWNGLTSEEEHPEWEEEVLRTLRNPGSVSFVNELNAELKKIGDFFDEMVKVLEERLDALPALDVGFEQAKRSLVDIGEVSSKLREYSVVNFTGTVKILKKHDKYTRSNLRPVYVRRILEVQPFHMALGRIVKRVIAKRYEVENYAPQPGEDSGAIPTRMMSMRTSFNRDLNNDLVSKVVVKKEALCLVVRNQDTEILAVQDDGALGVRLIKGSLESGESTADAAVREVRELAGEDVEVDRRLGEYKSATRKNTVYDAYLLTTKGPISDWTNPSGISKFWITYDQALVRIQDYSSLRVINAHMGKK